MSDSQKRAPRPALLALAIGAAYCIALAVFATLLGTWTDEEYTLATTAHGVAYAWHRAIAFEVQAPLYFAILAVWREANDSAWFARLFSVLSATGFFFALMPLLRRIAPERNPLWPALLIAFNPFVIYSALDIRLYATALLISTLGYTLFDAAFAAGTSTRARIWFVVLSVVGLYTQYFLGFALVGYAVLLIVRGRFRALVPYGIALLVIGVASIPLLGILHSQIGASGETAVGTAELLKATLLHPWTDLVLPRDPDLGDRAQRVFYYGALLAIVLLVLYARPATNTITRGAIACAATIEAIFVAVVMVLRLDLNMRHYVVLFVPLVVAGYALILDMRRGRAAWAGTALTWVYGVATLAVCFAQERPIAETGDTKRVAAYLQAHASSNAVIAIFPADAVPAYARQYAGPAKLVPFPRALSTEFYDLGGIRVHSEQEALAGFARLRGVPELWFVMMGACTEGYGCLDVLAAMRESGRVVTERDFYDNRIFELDLRR